MKTRFAMILVAWGALTLCSTNVAEAQSTRRQYQQWASGTFTARLTDGEPGPLLWFDAHARRAPGATVVILRPALGLRLSDVVSVYAGYAWIPTMFNGAGRNDEHRFWQQLILAWSLSRGWSFQSRTRTELRFGEGDDVGFRARQFVRLGWVPGSGPLGVVMWDELFLGLRDTDWGNVAGYDQNRLFVGIQLAGRDWGRTEVGYLLVHLNRSPNLLAHVLSLNLFFSV